MTEEQFMNDISPLPEHSEFYYVNGDLNLGEFAYSRAYVKFVNFDELLIFKDRFDDYVFMDSRGYEFPAIVEYAPLQKMPRRSSVSKQTHIKQDVKMNTIESDPEYLAFVEELQNNTNGPSPPPYSADALLEEIENNKTKDKDSQLTPLLEFLSRKREEKNKIQEEKKRKKDEAKKKKNDEKKAKAKEIKAKEQQVKRKQAKSPEDKARQVTTYVIKVKETTEENRPKPVQKAPKTSEGASVGGKAIKALGEKGEKEKKEKEPKQTRIRNKDRPAREIYRPGGGGKAKAQVQPAGPSTSGQSGEATAPMVQPSKPPQAATGDEEKKGANTNAVAKGQPSKFKNRVFTRTKN